MNGRQWRLSRRITETVASRGGLTDRQLAEELGVSATELRPVIGMLIRTGRLDNCQGYLVVPPGAAQHERDA